jgi:hypothetical protein
MDDFRATVNFKVIQRIYVLAKMHSKMFSFEIVFYSNVIHIIKLISNHILPYSISKVA